LENQKSKFSAKFVKNSEAPNANTLYRLIQHQSQQSWKTHGCTDCHRKNFSIICAREIKQIKDEKLFARTLKKVLSEHNFYDIHEFLIHKL